MFGDFNVVREPVERLGFAFSQNSANHCNDFIMQAVLHDVKMRRGRGVLLWELEKKTK